MQTSGDVVIRRAKESDLPALGRLGGLLLRMHHRFNPQRFMAPGADPEKGYAWFFSTQLTAEDVVIFVAERDSEVVGYVYAGIEPQSWKELRKEAGFIHDVVVDESRRRAGIASALIEAAIEWLRARGMPRVMLSTAEQNEDAQRLFARLGFRRTMIEMTRELDR